MNKEMLLLAGIIIGILMFLIYPMYGIFGTVLGMTDSFKKISEEPNLAPGGLAQGINQSLIFAIAGIAFSGVGLILGICCTVLLVKVRKDRINKGVES